MNDIELLSRYVRERSQQDFAELVRRHLGLVYSSALRRLGGDSHRAQDVAQQVFVALANHAARLVKHESLTGWLYTTTRNLSLNAIRAERRRQAREHIAHTGGIALSDAAHEPNWAEVGPELDAVMDELEEDDRLALLWRFFEGKNFAQIGSLLRVQEDAARMRVNRALERLRTQLGSKGIQSTAAVLGGLLTTRVTAEVPGALADQIGVAVQAVLPKAAASATGAMACVAAVSVLLSLGLSVGWWREHREASALHSQLSASRETGAQLVKEVERLEKRARFAEESKAVFEDRVEASLREIATREAAASAKAAEIKTPAEASLIGQVRHPGRFRLGPGMSVGAVIAKAGGLSESGARNGILVTRGGERNKQVYKIDLDRTVETDDGIKTAQFMVQPNDRIYVPERLLIGR